MSHQETFQRWRRSAALSLNEQAELERMKDDEAEIESRFFAQLEFGTAGLRGVMGLGLNRMNLHVIRHATQAFAQVILEEGGDAAQRGVAVCFDCRNNSRLFAREAACVMAGNGIRVRLFDDLRPTPELSFAIREYGCIAGINITASHNPKEYNGYKAYWQDGTQLPPGPAERVAETMRQLDVFDSIRREEYDAALSAGRITLLGQETDEKFLACVMAQACDRQCVAQVADRFNMVFTPFHGAGYRLIPEALRRLGLRQVHCVPQQMVLDGDFPTVASPNPENPESFALAIALAEEVGADFILGSDPDADRVGILARTPWGEMLPISGNQTGVLLLDYLIRARLRAGTLPENPVALKTIVTTEMARRVAEENGLRCYDTFTGFKFLAEKKDRLEETGEGTVIFSYEESYGYMLGDFVRDKDAVTASLLLAEMAAWYAGQGMTLYEALETLYEKYGYYGERTLNLVMPGLDGLKRMSALMEGLRKQPPAEIAGTPVVWRKDYLDGAAVQVETGRREEMELSGSNVLRYELADGASLIVRPSGTEPKVKVYLLVRGDDARDCRERLDRYAAWAQTLNN